MKHFDDEDKENNYASCYPSRLLLALHILQKYL
jgi:hypothetical protein